MDALNVIQRLGGGHLIDELADAIVKVSEEAVATGKPGQVTLKLKISHPQKGYEPLVVVVEDQITLTWPKQDGLGAMFFVHEGDLHRDDPRQTSFELREVQRDEPEIRRAAEEAAEQRKVE